MPSRYPYLPSWLPPGWPREVKAEGYVPRGERHFRATVSEQEVLEIRRLHREEHLSFEEIAGRFEGIGRIGVRLICHGHRWKHLPGAVTPESKESIARRSAQSRPTVLTEAHVREARERVAAGETVAEVVADLGYKEFTLNGAV